MVKLNITGLVIKEVKIHGLYKHIKMEQKTYIMIDRNTNYYKIGKSLNPLKREKTLQSEKPTIELLFVCDNNVEKVIHKEYNEKRIRGEWFDLKENDILDLITNYNFIKNEFIIVKKTKKVRKTLNNKPIIECVEKGLIMKEIVERTGLCERAIRKRLRQIGMTTKGNKQQKTKDLVQKFRHNNPQLTQKQVVEHLNLSLTSIKRYWNESLS